MVERSGYNFADWGSNVSSPEVTQEPPARTGDINRIMIQEKLQQLGVSLDDISLGSFDEIGEFTAKKKRSPDSDLYKSVGAYFRPNYERGLLIYALIKKYNVKSYLEIGFGRGYSCFCATMALSETTGGSVTVVDPVIDDTHLQNLTKVFPKEWFEKIDFCKATSDEFFNDRVYFNEIRNSFDMIYIDGDHRYDYVKRDWENAKDRFKKIVLFDDYHLPGKRQKGIEVSSLIDSIDDYTKELIITDRRIFLDDRGYTDGEIDYGQVLLTNSQGAE